MEPPSNLVLVVASEGLFLAFAFLVAWLLITRRKLLAKRARLARREIEAKTLRQCVQEASEQLHAANEQIKQLSAHPPQDDQLLLNYQRRIANLEKFKELYFELETRIAAADSISEDSKNNAEELNHYKQRAQELEVTEMRLQRELAQYQCRLEELAARQSTAPTHGVVRLKEVEDLNSRLQQRESEIRRLRQECETIGQQYEELATKSMAMIGDGDDLTEDQKMELEELKRQLEENAAALARKQAECQLLENYYLELEGNSELAKATEQMQQSSAERDALQAQQREIGSRVESVVSQEAAEEMAKLRQALADKELSLSEMRDDYKEVKEQFLEVAQEEGELRKSNQMLIQECEKLRLEVSELSEARRDFTDQKNELEKLRDEYSKMESRYLTLVEKHQR